MKRLLLPVLAAFSIQLLAGETQLETLKSDLLERLKPLKAEASIADKTITIKFNCDKFMIHSQGKDGSIDPTPGKEEGPNVDGVRIIISIFDGKYLV